MLKDTFLKRIVFIDIILWFIFSILFSILSFWNVSLLVGWNFGALASLCAFFLNVWTTKKLLAKRRTYWGGFWFGVGKSFVQMILYALFIILVLLINGVSHGKLFWESGMEIIFYPINIFTFIAGMSLIMISTLLSNIQILKKKEDKNGNYS